MVMLRALTTEKNMNKAIKCFFIIGNTVMITQANIQFNIVVKETVGG